MLLIENSGDGEQRVTMLETSVATSGQNGMKESRVKAQFADLSKQVPDAKVEIHKAKPVT